MELKLCCGNQIANGRTDRGGRTDAREYNIICPFGHIQKTAGKEDTNINSATDVPLKAEVNHY
jgi:hypothetical protein